MFPKFQQGSDRKSDKQLKKRTPGYSLANIIEKLLAYHQITLRKKFILGVNMVHHTMLQASESH